MDKNFDCENFPEQLLHNLLFLMKTQEDFKPQLNNILNVFKLQKNDTKEIPLTICSILSGTNETDFKW